MKERRNHTPQQRKLLDPKRDLLQFAETAETCTDKTSGRRKRPATATVATRAERSDEGTASDDGSEGECDYECSECLGSYQQDIEENNGAEWVHCGCGQWIHQDCIDQVMTGTDSKDRMRSNCVSVYNMGEHCNYFNNIFT